MLNKFSRTELLLGGEAMKKLYKSRVAVFGIGGVGGFAAEALARSGVGGLDLFDNDRVSLTNINRQIIALTNTVGKYKTELMKERIALINPEAAVNAYNVFYSSENASDYDFSHYDYIIDAIDTVSAKIELIANAQRSGVRIISSMGAGNKLDPTKFEVADIYKTSVCPLARVMRSELRKRGIKKLKVVYSREEPIAPVGETDEPPQAGRRSVPGSIAFVPSVAGLIIAGEVIKDLIKD